MVRHSFITFRSHPCEKYLQKEFLTLLSPLLGSNNHIIATESRGTVEEHIHLILEVSDTIKDTDKLKQKFRTKPFKKWYDLIKPLMTIIDTNLNEAGLQVKLLEQNLDAVPHGLRYKIGYTTKENDFKSVGFSDEVITDGIQFYHLMDRQPSKPDKTWKIVKINTAHAVLEDFAEKFRYPGIIDKKITCWDPDICYWLAKNKIFLNVSKREQEKLFASLEVANSSQDYDPTNRHHLKMQLCDGYTDQDDPKFCKPQVYIDENQRLMALLKEHNIPVVSKIQHEW